MNSNHFQVTKNVAGLTITGQGPTIMSAMSDAVNQIIKMHISLDQLDKFPTYVKFITDAGNSYELIAPLSFNKSVRIITHAIVMPDTDPPLYYDFSHVIKEPPKHTKDGVWVNASIIEHDGSPAIYAIPSSMPIALATYRAYIFGIREMEYTAHDVLSFALLAMARINPDVALEVQGPILK